MKTSRPFFQARRSALVLFTTNHNQFSQRRRQLD
jgi:hypothetical protein